ncbi:hypothetical protein Clacol_005831 [Clathrus columnatus]|uniref:G domain-containing protein n=1 Tax=Clathrus columnatus TaxID=1419009 RepID=A0AAV5AAD8_9AGAM|nr:hypothetical protein Clacol_005831 [Clathrus columnatus]
MFNLGNTRGKRQKCFRILIIGRANAGKTTLLKHISNADSSEALVYNKVRRRLSINPTKVRGIHDIDQSFYFPSNPRFIFHDSPGFETGDETQLKRAQEFIYSRSKEWQIEEQLHAIWFCLLTNASRPLLELETKFFNEERPGNVPVIAIFTKFDDLITQFYDPELGLQENRQVAEQILETSITEIFERGFRDFQYNFVEIMGWFPHTPIFSHLKIKLKREHLNWSGIWKLTEKTFRENLFPGNSENLDMIGAVALCAENSFWHCALGVPFIQALQQSIEKYKISDSRRTIEAAIQEMGFSQSFSDENKQKEIIELVCNNRLPRPPGMDIEP